MRASPSQLQLVPWTLRNVPLKKICLHKQSISVHKIASKAFNLHQWIPKSLSRRRMLLDDAATVEALVLGSWPGPQELGEHVPVPVKQLEVAVASGIFAGLTDL